MPMDEPLREHLTAGIGCGVFVAVGSALFALLYGHSTGPNGMALFFPYSALLGRSSVILFATGAIVALLQWPAYGALIGAAMAGGPRLSRIATWGCVVAFVAHGIAFSIAVGDGP